MASGLFISLSGNKLAKGAVYLMSKLIKCAWYVSFKAKKYRLLA